MLCLLLCAMAGWPRPAGAAMPAVQIPWLWDEAELPSWSAQDAAILHQHILLSGATARIRPRMRQPLLPAGMRVTPVLHVELSTVHPPQKLESRRALLIGAMQRAAAASNSGWVQLDMEAKPSQRLFYLSLVRDLRAALPSQIKLSVTALTWWCRAPGWLDELDADEVVPMFFRMGRDSAALRTIIEHSPALLHARCRSGSAGFSPQEAFAPQVAARYTRRYWFDQHAWKQAATVPD
ncbi:hypothetical protein HSX11_04485 [Oxalobacteraceae bacterium]|nr:hypothetical protein [Oxalobacteraceae bacterium]